MSVTFEPIGYFRSSAKERYDAPRQAGLEQSSAYIELLPHCNYEQALEDLEGFERLWVLFCFDRNDKWKPKVLPPRGEKKRGVFATRSPHRPNPIGMSCLELQEIDGLRLYVSDPDLLDGTPVLDIKPYVVYADAFPDAQQGWLAKLPADRKWAFDSTDLDEVFDYLRQDWDLDLRTVTERLLTRRPTPGPNRRIRILGAGEYELAYKTWRISYTLDESRSLIALKSLASGYSAEELAREIDPWGDLEVHRAWIARVSR